MVVTKDVTFAPEAFSPPRDETPRKTEHPEKSAETVKPARDRVDVSTAGNPAGENPGKTEYGGMGYGKRYSYKIDSENGVVVRILDSDTLKEIRQIPTKEVQGVKRAYRKAVARLFDRTA